MNQFQVFPAADEFQLDLVDILAEDLWISKNSWTTDIQSLRILKNITKKIYDPLKGIQGYPWGNLWNPKETIEILEEIYKILKEIFNRLKEIYEFLNKIYEILKKSWKFLPEIYGILNKI